MISEPSFPTLFAVGVQAFQPDAEDEFGVSVARWADPVRAMVYGWGAPQGAEPKVVGHDRIVVEIELLVPPGFSCAARDRIVLDFDPDTYNPNDPTGVYDVVGPIEGSDHNPFGWNPGGVVNLVNVSG